MKAKKSLEEEINDFLILWDIKNLSAFMHDLLPLVELFNVSEEQDWVKDAVGKEDTEAVRVARTVYLLSKLAELHGPKISSTNTNFRGLWKRMEQNSQ